MGILDLQTRITTGETWRLAFRSDDPGDYQYVRSCPGSTMSKDKCSFPLDMAVLDWFYVNVPPSLWEPSARLEEWIERLKSTRAAVAKLTEAKYTRVDLDLPYAHKLYDYQTVGVKWLVERRRGILADEPGLGKAQPIDSKVLTPNGFVELSTIVVGDRITDPDGGIGIVTGVYPRGIRQVYRVILSDGTSTECCEDHLWNVQTHNDRNRGRHRVVSCKDIISSGITDGTRALWYVPINAPVVFDQIESLPLDPYLLGVLLGDGSTRSNTPMISSADEQILTAVRAKLPDGLQLVHSTGYDYRITHGQPNKPNALKDKLVGLHLWGKLSSEKFIPNMYLRGTIDNRLELLRGLMDTDGDMGSAAVFNTSSPQLADDVADLVRSLGGFVTLGSRLPTYQYKDECRIGKEAYRLNIRMQQNPFSLARKADKWKPARLTRSIRDIIPTRCTETLCISVNTKRSLYCTDQYIVTHNTIQSLAAADLCGANRILILTVNETVQNQWADTIESWNLGSTTVVRGTKVERTRAMEVSSRWTIAPSSILSTKDSLLKRRLQQKWDCIIIDEAHMMQSKDSLRGQMAAKLKSDYMFLLTGTPVWNKLPSLWNLLHIVDKARWSGYWLWIDRYFSIWNSPFGRQVGAPRRDMEPMLRAEIGQVLLRRELLEVCKDFPVATIHEIKLELSEEMRAEYKRLQNAVRDYQDVSVCGRDYSITSAVQRIPILRAFVNQSRGVSRTPYPDLAGSSTKLDAIVGAVHKARLRGLQCLVFTWHTDYADYLAEQIGGGARSTHGKKPSEQRANDVGAFRAKDFDCLVASMSSLGVGVDLPDVDVLIFAECDWTPAIIEQSWRRIYRINSTTQKLILFVYYEKTVEELIFRAFSKKQALSDELLADQILED